MVLARNDWVENYSSPYCIKFDDDEEFHSFWGPKQIIQRAELRFKVGDRVERACKDDYLPGTIVRLWPRNDFYEEGASCRMR